MSVGVVNNLSELADHIFEKAKTNRSKIIFIAVITLGLIGVIIGGLASVSVIMGCKTISSLFITGVMGSSLAIIIITCMYKEKF